MISLAEQYLRLKLEAAKLRADVEELEVSRFSECPDGVGWQ